MHEDVVPDSLSVIPYLVAQDFYNLVDVYMDAVFFPNCVRDPKTFAQEGWHYELEKPEVAPHPSCAACTLLSPEHECPMQHSHVPPLLPLSCTHKIRFALPVYPSSIIS